MVSGRVCVIKVNGRQNIVSKYMETGGHRLHSGNRSYCTPEHRAQAGGGSGSHSVRPTEHTGPERPARDRLPKLWERKNRARLNWAGLPLLHLRKEMIQTLPTGGQSLGNVPRPMPTSQRCVWLSVINSRTSAPVLWESLLCEALIHFKLRTSG